MEFEEVGTVGDGTVPVVTVNIYAGLGGRPVVELMGKGGRITLPPEDAPKLAILLSMAHERLTRDAREA